MGCSSCSSNGLPKGCKSNGSCGTGGCEKLQVFDWLADMELPSGHKPFDIVEVRFKNGRKEFYRNVNDLTLRMGDAVAVEGSPGHDVGTISLQGELVKLQMKAKEIPPHSDQIKKLYRIATQRDLDIWKSARDREKETMFRSRELAIQLDLKMKISDVEFQGDGTKAIFYYTADQRVDFRQLIKDLAGTFKIRVEMRQIGARQEAARLGGIGSCGRELCCSTWLTDFRSVNTSAARYQQLSLNPQKLAGQCGKLKCCLNYELDSYLEAIKEFPPTDQKLFTKKGDAYYQKMDIFQGIMWYAYPDSGVEWVPLPVDRVKEIMALNDGGKKPEALEQFAVTTKENDLFASPAEEDDLTRFDNQGRRKKKRKGPRNKGGNPKAKTEAKGKGGPASGDKPRRDQKPKSERQGPAPEGQKPRSNKKRRPNNRRGRNPNKPPQNEG